jgi:hypothetical protein
MQPSMPNMIEIDPHQLPATIAHIEKTLDLAKAELAAHLEMVEAYKKSDFALHADMEDSNVRFQETLAQYKKEFGEDYEPDEREKTVRQLYLNKELAELARYRATVNLHTAHANRVQHTIDQLAPQLHALREAQRQLQSGILIPHLRPPNPRRGN